VGKTLAQSRTMRGTRAAGVATVGAASIEVAQEVLTKRQGVVLPLVCHLDTLHCLFIALVLGVIAVVIWAASTTGARGCAGVGRPVILGALVMAGQICVAATRFLVEESIRSEFEQRMVEAFRAVRVGPGNDPQSQMGALISKQAEARLKGLIEQAGDEGELLLRGANPCGADAPGAFLTPTLFRIDNPDSTLVQEELFGPMVSVEGFADEAAATMLANATRYGLAASVHTCDLERAMRLSRAVRSGNPLLGDLAHGANPRP
jgi:delta 1-pyrroline-5-carboxylate dehydrogenase